MSNILLDYESKVPEDVRKANVEKLEGNEAEVARLAEAVQALKAMDIQIQMVPSSSLEIWLFQAQLKLARTGGYPKLITWAKRSS